MEAQAGVAAQSSPLPPRVDVCCGDMEGVFLVESSLVLVGGVVPITANNFERLSNKTSNKWRDMIKVKPSAFAAGADGAAAAPPAGGRRAHSLREWAARRGVALGDPDVEAATAQCTIPYDDERVPLDGVGREHHIEEGWVAVEDPAAGGFAIGYVWHNPQGELMFISVHPEHTNKRDKDPAPRKSPPAPAAAAGKGAGAAAPAAAAAGGKRRRGERRPRARLFDPAMQRWFSLGGDPLPHPERLELLTHPQAMPTLMQAPRDLVAALQRKLDDAECGFQYDLRLDCLSAEHKRQIKVAKDKEGRSDGSIRVAGPVTKYADKADVSKDGFLRRPEAVAKAILQMITNRGEGEEDGGGGVGVYGGAGAGRPVASEAAASVGAPSASAAAPAPRVRLPLRPRAHAPPRGAASVQQGPAPAAAAAAPGRGCESAPLPPRGASPPAYGASECAGPLAFPFAGGFAFAPQAPLPCFAAPPPPLAPAAPFGFGAASGNDMEWAGLAESMHGGSCAGGGAGVGGAATAAQHDDFLLAPAGSPRGGSLCGSPELESAPPAPRLGAACGSPFPWDELDAAAAAMSESETDHLTAAACSPLALANCAPQMQCYAQSLLQQQLQQQQQQPLLQPQPQQPPKRAAPAPEPAQTTSVSCFEQYDGLTKVQLLEMQREAAAEEAAAQERMMEASARRLAIIAALEMQEQAERATAASGGWPAKRARSS